MAFLNVYDEVRTHLVYFTYGFFNVSEPLVCLSGCFGRIALNSKPLNACVSLPLCLLLTHSMLTLMYSFIIYAVRSLRDP